ncbi:MAG: Uncharacterised protein [Methanobacteriota archaeon]|nr:MAG: Uncharacterised protein [Euryarchaeota archaeon]
MVAVPPILEKITSEISRGTGFKSNTLASWIVTGVSNNIVVTLSKNAESTAVTTHKITTKVQTLPLLLLYACTAHHSKTPVCDITPTITIIPSNNPMVSHSIIVVTSANESDLPMK